MPKSPLVSKPERVFVSMAMSPDLVERIDALAKEETRNRSQMIRRLVLRGLETLTEPSTPPPSKAA